MLLAIGCAPEEQAPGSGGNADGGGGNGGDSASCAVDDLETMKPGTLTIGTDKPAYEPWFVGDDPSNGKGFESAVAYAVAEEMGFAKDDVKWAHVRFNAAIQPGEKNFDFDINQFSITPQRQKVVDFSEPYYDVTQAVITVRGSELADTTSLQDLAEAELGAQVNTSSFDAITNVIQPDTRPRPFNTNNDARQALQNGTIEALVVDLPTAYYMVDAQMDDGTILGQLPPDEQGTPEQFGLLLDKGSPLTDCVNDAVGKLREDGTLDELADRWLNEATDAPELS